MAIFACSDLHGRYDLYEKIKAFLKPEDKVYFLGDAGDRGPDGWKLIVAILNDPQFIYLKGNHEDMLVQAIQSYREAGEMYYYEATYQLSLNGGLKTFNDWLYQTKGDDSYIRHLKELPYYTSYTNKDGYFIWLSHSGYPPFRNKYTKQFVVPERLALWDRDHCWVPRWGNENLDMIIVHGHTPIPYFLEGTNIEMTPGAFWYCDNHKVCLDNASYVTGYTCLLDLDTFDEHIIYADNTPKEKKD